MTAIHERLLQRRAVIVCPALLSILLLGAGFCRPVASQQIERRVGNELNDARKVGWLAVRPVIERMKEVAQPNTPGTQAWLKDFAEQTNGLDPNDPPAEWPKVDIDALATRNANFWRAYFEILPGDPGATQLYVGLLLGCGECARAFNILEFQLAHPGLAPETYQNFGALHQFAKAADKTVEPLINEGIQRFDNADYEGARKKYEEALAVWPQSGWAHYELAYTLYAQQMIAAGEKPTFPTEGFTVQVASEVKVIPSPEVKAQYARCRRYSPFMLQAYQGDEQEVIEAGRSLATDVFPGLQYLGQNRNAADAEEVLKKMVEGCQKAGLHDYAILLREILVARRGEYDRSDHPVFVKALRALVPGSVTEDTLERLAAPQALFYGVIKMNVPPDQPVAPRTFKLGTTRYVRDKNDQKAYSILVRVEVQDANHFNDPGLKIAHVIFDDAIKTPTVDVKSDTDFSDVTPNADGSIDLSWKVHSIPHDVSGKAHSKLTPPVHKIVGNQCVMQVDLEDLPDKDMALMVFDKTQQPISNVLLFRKADFQPGDADAIFESAVSKLEARARDAAKKP